MNPTAPSLLWILMLAEKASGNQWLIVRSCTYRQFYNQVLVSTSTDALLPPALFYLDEWIPHLFFLLRFSSIVGKPTGDSSSISFASDRRTAKTPTGYQSPRNPWAKTERKTAYYRIPTKVEMSLCVGVAGDRRPWWTQTEMRLHNARYPQYK